MGDNQWAQNLLLELINNNYDVQFVGLRQKKDLYLQNLAKKHDIKSDFISINSQKYLNLLDKLKPDYIVSMSYDEIFKNSILDSYKVINCHCGMLPNYRGRNPLNWVLINAEKYFGITVHMVDENIDTGDIILQGIYPINIHHTYKDLRDFCYIECKNIVISALEKLKIGSMNIRKQGEHGIYCVKRQLQDEYIDWNQKSYEIYNFIRALYDDPCAKSNLGSDLVNIEHDVIIKRALYSNNLPIYKGIPGSILKKTDNYILVKTGNSWLKIIDYESKIKLKVGDRLCR
jgi:methionyl-tRNA formyltransferase